MAEQYVVESEVTALKAWWKALPPETQLSLVWTGGILSVLLIIYVGFSLWNNALRRSASGNDS